MIVAGALGGVLLLVLALIAVYVIGRRRKRYSDDTARWVTEHAASAYTERPSSVTIVWSSETSAVGARRRLHEPLSLVSRPPSDSTAHSSVPYAPPTECSAVGGTRSEVVAPSSPRAPGPGLARRSRPPRGDPAEAQPVSSEAGIVGSNSVVSSGPGSCTPAPALQLWRNEAFESGGPGGPGTTPGSGDSGAEAARPSAPRAGGAAGRARQGPSPGARRSSPRGGGGGSGAPASSDELTSAWAPRSGSSGEPPGPPVSRSGSAPEAAKPLARDRARPAAEEEVEVAGLGGSAPASAERGGSAPSSSGEAGSVQSTAAMVTGPSAPHAGLGGRPPRVPPRSVSDGGEAVEADEPPAAAAAASPHKAPGAAGQAAEAPAEAAMGAGPSTSVAVPRPRVAAGPAAARGARPDAQRAPAAAAGDAGRAPAHGSSAGSEPQEPGSRRGARQGRDGAAPPLRETPPRSRLGRGQ
jgi:translation initiation factor IF-2